MSMVKLTLPGTTEMPPGRTSKRPMVKRIVSVSSRNASRKATAMSVAATKASLRRLRGVVPEWASWPVTSTRKRR